jgi:hypothetical protein
VANSQRAVLQGNSIDDRFYAVRAIDSEGYPGLAVLAEPEE